MPSKRSAPAVERTRPRALAGPAQLPGEAAVRGIRALIDRMDAQSKLQERLFDQSRPQAERAVYQGVSDLFLGYSTAWDAVHRVEAKISQGDTFDFVFSQDLL